MFDQQSSPDSRRTALTLQLASSENDAARWAAHELRVRGWLTDGSLAGAVLSGADLRGADLMGADLQRTGRFDAAKRKTLASAGVDRVAIRTDQDYAKALTIFFQKRAKQIRH